MKQKENSKKNIFEFILDKHFNLWNNKDLGLRKEITLLVQNQKKIYEEKFLKKLSLNDFYELYEYENRQSKYVINMNRVAEFFGFDWRMPLWDSRFIKFWNKIPDKFKIDQKLYVNTINLYNPGNVWRNTIPVNKKKVYPITIRYVRNIFKLFFIIFGKKSKEYWHKFDIKYFYYFYDVTRMVCLYSYKEYLNSKNHSTGLCHVSIQSKKYLESYGKYFKKIKLIFLYIFIKIYFYIFDSKIIKNDKFGLTYYVWKDTRPIDTFLNKIRTDDTTVIIVIKEIIKNDLNRNQKNIFFDIGAYIGIITLIFNKFSNKGSEIHSFEPLEKKFLRLKENIKLNKIDTIYLNNHALGDKKELVTLEDPKDPGMTKIVKKNSNNFNGNFYHNINSDTLESYVLKKNVSNINFIKIDTEGYDSKVLEGSKNLLKKKQIDYLIVEYMHSTEDSNEVSRILKNNGYKIFYLLRNEGKLTDDLNKINLNKSNILNILAISPNKDQTVISKLKI